MSTTDGELVEDYLDQLYAGLRGSPRRGRRILAEAEDHLRQGVAEGMTAGLTEREAQESAISSFGSVRAVVRAHDTPMRRMPGVAIIVDVAMATWKLGSIGLLAVGASGLVAAVMNTLLGRSFVGAVAPGATPPADACRYWLSIWPGAHSCTQAYMLENSSDTVTLRILAGFLGLLLLIGYGVARRRGWGRGALPDSLTATVAMSLFGAAGLGLLILTLGHGTVNYQSGPGFYLSGAVVALAMAAAFGWRLQRTLLRHARR
jgi:hypothetical protein